MHFTIIYVFTLSKKHEESAVPEYCYQSLALDSSRSWVYGV